MKSSPMSLAKHPGYVPFPFIVVSLMVLGCLVIFLCLAKSSARLNSKACIEAYAKDRGISAKYWEEDPTHRSAYIRAVTACIQQPM